MVFEGLRFVLSFVRSKLWKKFCKTSCCVCPPAPGLGAPETLGVTGERVAEIPVGEEEVPSADRADGRPVEVLVEIGLAANLRVATSPKPVDVPPMPVSISLNAFSTFGRLKLLLPKGPTIPAVAPATSCGFLKAPRGSLSDFFEFSS